MSEKLFDIEKHNIFCYDPELRTWKQLLQGHDENGKFAGMKYIQTNNKELHGKFILPGFIDAHCHLLENPYPNDSNAEGRSIPSIALYNALIAAQSGITSLKDMGGYEYKAIEILKMLANFKVPRLFSSGCYFTVPDGHCSDRGAIIIHDLNNFTTALKRLLDNEIKFCKIINSDNGFSLELLSKMINYAHEKGMMVSCHAYTEKAARVAVEAGTDTLEHAGNYSEELINLILKNRVIVVPTYVAAVDSTPENCKDISGVDASVLREWINGENMVIPKLIKHGVRIALGTDSGFLGTPCDSLLREVELLHKNFNISIPELLYFAIVITPMTVGMKGKLGLIEDGYYADCLCYDENPLEDIEVLTKPKEVWVNGNRIDEAIQNKTVIRRLAKKDIQMLTVHIKQSFFDCAGLDDFWTDDEIENWINDPNDYCAGAFVEGRLIGFCLTHHHKTANKVHIENIFVDYMYREKGIAQYLIFDVITHYRSVFSKVRFVGLVDVTNKKSVDLLLRNNFTKGHPMLWMQYNSYERL